MGVSSGLSALVRVMLCMRSISCIHVCKMRFEFISTLFKSLVRGTDTMKWES